MPLKTRLDAIYNTLTGQGAGKDVSFDVSATSVLSFAKLGEIYRNSGYAQRAVDLPVNDALRNGYVFVGQDGKADQQIATKWDLEEERLNIDAVVRKAMKWSRAYGTAYILLVTKDGAPIDSALNLDKLEEVTQLLVLSPDQCKPYDFSLVASRSGADFLHPSQYILSLPLQIQKVLSGIPSRWSPALTGNAKIHHTRLIRVVGRELLDVERLSSVTEGDSIIQAVFRELSQMVGIDNAASVLAAEMKQDVIKIPALEAIAISDAADAFEERMTLLKRSKSLLNMIILGRDEEFVSRQNIVTGFKDLGQQAKDAWVAVTGIPEPVFFGKASTGLSGSAGTETETYAALLKVLWIEKIGPVYRRLLEVMKAQEVGPLTKGDRHVVQLKPVREESAKDISSRRLVDAQRDAMYVGAGILPVEYIQERFKAPGGWTDELPPYDPKKWPLPVMEEEPAQPSGGGSPNPEGKNAPGQKPALPGPPKAEAPGAQGVDVRGSLQNTGERSDLEPGE